MGAALCPARHEQPSPATNAARAKVAHCHRNVTMLPQGIVREDYRRITEIWLPSSTRAPPVDFNRTESWPHGFICPISYRPGAIYNPKRDHSDTRICSLSTIFS